MIYTIGHSNHDIATFLRLTTGAGVEAVADVRSTPYSKYNLQYRQAELRQALREAGVHYVYLGDGLGGKTKDRRLCTDGKPDHRLIAASPKFAEGIKRLISGAKQYSIAIMCAEADPSHCHRTHLVTPALLEAGEGVTHILKDGTLQPHAALLDIFGEV